MHAIIATMPAATPLIDVLVGAVITASLFIGRATRSK
jgi:hypothetical protein